MMKEKMNVKKLIISILLLGILIFSALTTINNQNPNEPLPKTPNDMLFEPLEQKNGFHIYQYIEESWEQQYHTTFPIEYEQQDFTIQTQTNQLRITILHTGSHFADIEQITLTMDGTIIKPQTAIRTKTRENILFDIMNDDLNVVVAHEQPLEITWTLPTVDYEELILSINANEYGWFGRPFYFSDGVYQPGTRYQTITVDGILDKNLGPPAHQIFWEPSSGHPNGYTYIYVSEDNENLYFSFDITCDNSNEYGDDWAEITINHQVYRIDDFYSKWGRLGFGYTDKVTYKHQTAEFCIPKPNTNAPINFSFQYYGTAITEDGSIIDIDLNEQTIRPNQQKAVQYVQVKDHGADGGALSIDYFTIFNDGSASNSQIARLSLWRDHGDGEFDGGAGDDTLVGEPVLNPDLTSGEPIGGMGDGNIVNIANGLSYYFWIVIDLHQDAEEHGETIQTKINGTLSSTSYSNWKPYWKSGFEMATSQTTINASPTGTLNVDTNPVSENDLDFTISVIYDEPMDETVIPTLQFIGNSGALTAITGGWVTSVRYDRTYSITDVDEGSIVTVESSGGKDISGNVEGPCNPVNFTIDTAQPIISDITGDTTGTTGEKTTIEGVFSDNIEVDTATIYYKIQDGIWKSKSIFSGQTEISIPSDTLQPWMYYIEVQDTSSNIKNEPVPPAVYEITVTDNDPPLLNDNSPGSCVAGQSYIFYATSIDNIDETPTVYVEYWYDEEAHVSKTMIPATGDYYQYQITIPLDADTFNYIISSKDSSDNWRETNSISISVDSEGENDPGLVHPESNPGGPYYEVINTEVIFDGTDSTDSDGMITNYSWTFGDGSEGYGANPTHMYNSEGVFTVTLLVTDNHGLTHLNSTMATISDTTDTDDDGYPDDMEESYQTNTTNDESYPVDTDMDGIPDDDSEDQLYQGDTDDDNDGIADEIETSMGSDPKNDMDVIMLDDINGYLIDTDNDTVPDTYYEPDNQTETQIVEQDDGTLGLDVDDDGIIEYIYDTETGVTKNFTEPDAKEESFPFIILAVGIIIAIIFCIGVYFYIYKVR